jgi:hypothetical protein
VLSVEAATALASGRRRRGRRRRRRRVGDLVVGGDGFAVEGGELFGAELVFLDGELVVDGGVEVLVLVDAVEDVGELAEEEAGGDGDLAAEAPKPVVTWATRERRKGSPTLPLTPAFDVTLRSMWGWPPSQASKPWAVP